MGCSSSSASHSRDERRGPRNVQNRELSKTNPYRHGFPITQAELDRQRQEFWSTRVDGSPIMWQGIKTAAEALLADDVPLARAILEASNIMTPYGSLELCYDERGFQYKVPVFCIANPIELIDAAGNAIIKPETVVVTEGKEGIKQVAPVESPLTVRVRINPGDYNLSIMTSTADTVLDFKRLISAKTADNGTEGNVVVPDCLESRQRIMFLGRELQNHQYLGDCKVDGTQVVQIFLRPLPKQPTNSASSSSVSQ